MRHKPLTEIGKYQFMLFAVYDQKRWGVRVDVVGG
jgi:hypothetical protein